VRLSQQIAATDVTALSKEQLLTVASGWKDKAEEMEELLLRADQALKCIRNVVVHPSARSVVAKRDQEFNELRTLHAIAQKKAEMYAKSALMWQGKYEEATKLV